MKKVIFVVLLFAIIDLHAQDQKQAIDSFSVIVNKFDDFFKSAQKLIYKEKYSKSTTGFIVEIIEYYSANLRYDIKKTESIITPFIGYIDIDFTDKSNEACGNVFYTIRDYKHFVGWDTEKGALDNANSLKCYEPQKDIDGKLKEPYVTIIRFEFAYQNNKWVYKSVIRKEYNDPAYTICGALGFYIEHVLPLVDKESIEFNDKWKALIK